MNDNVIKGPWPCETPGTPTPRVLIEGPKPIDLPLQTLWELYLEELLQFIWELKK